MQVAELSRRLKEGGACLRRIFHSPQLAAKQTAEQLAADLGLSAEEIEGLDPNDDEQEQESVRPGRVCYILSGLLVIR